MNSEVAENLNKKILDIYKQLADSARTIKEGFDEVETRDFFKPIFLASALIL